GKTEGKKCSVCGEILVAQEEIPALGHTEVTIPAEEATCAKAGKTEGKKCSVCGEILVAQKEVAALGHNFGEWTVTKPATESAAGEKTRKCSRCDATETKAIPKLEPTKPDSTDPTKTGEDGTAFGPGASAAAAEAAIAKMTSDADPAGSTFAKLKLVSKKQSKTSVTIKWTKVRGAAKYVIYGNQCGSKNKMKKIKTVSASKLSKKFTKIAGKKVKAGKSYKFLVVALDKNGMVVTSSKVVHAYTKGGKYTNHKSVKVKVGSKFVKAVTIKKGKTVKLQGVGIQAKANAGFKFHTKNGGMRFESTNKKVAAVSAKGVVKGKAAGTCYVYVYSQNGVAKKVKVTVK
ncbi:MAG: Ig-like domain-containing protein, partial [Coriobacteriia bacterium]|nr:Ig-like domain-containing protein [Coriobacteriia bacterium]